MWLLHETIWEFQGKACYAIKTPWNELKIGHNNTHFRDPLQVPKRLYLAVRVLDLEPGRRSTARISLSGLLFIHASVRADVDVSRFELGNRKGRGTQIFLGQRNRFLQVVTSRQLV